MLRSLALAAAVAVVACNGAGAEPKPGPFACDRFAKNPDGSWSAKVETTITFDNKMAIKFAPGLTVAPGGLVIAVGAPYPLDVAARLNADCSGR
jgi:hypothetical protein